MKSGTRRNVFVYGLLMLFGLGVILFHNEIISAIKEYLDATNEKPIATVNTVQGMVRHQPRGTISLSKVSVGKKLRHLDKIYTERDSTTHIKFITNDEILVLPNSEIVIEFPRNDPNQKNIVITFLRGNFELLKKTEPASLIIFKKGTIERTVASLQTVAPNNRLPPEKIDIVYPKNEKVLYNSPDKRVQLSWQDIAPDSEYQVELVDNGQVIQTFKTSEPQLDIEVPEQKSYQWKVKVNDPSREAESELSTFTITSQPAFEMISPRMNEKLSYQEAAQFKTQPFKYDSKLNETWVFIENTKTKEIYKEKEAPTFTHDLKEGQYRWGLSETSDELPEKWNNFSVHKTKKATVQKTVAPPETKAVPEPPKPTPPARPMPKPKFSKNGIEIPSIISPKSGAKLKSQGKTTEVPLELFSKGCKLYEVESDTNPDFSLPVIRRSSKNITSIKLNKGKHYIRARCWKTGDMGNWSAPLTKISID